MGLDIAALAANTATTEVDFMGQSAKVTYRPAVITTERLEKFDAPGAGDVDSDSGFLSFFCELVQDWDVKSGTKKVPLTTKGLKPVPLVLIRAVYLTIMSEASSGEAGRNSSGG